MCGYNCDNKHAPTEAMLNKGYGCSICGGGSAVQKGINDLSTTVPWMMRYIANPEDGYTYSKGCRKEIDFKCPDCGYVCSRIIANVYNQGFSCPRCDDGYSYPEKFVLSMLSQIGVKFHFQASRKLLPWCLNYKYDFLIEDLKILIETDGEQHSCNKGAFNVPVEEQKRIDKEKID